MPKYKVYFPATSEMSPCTCIATPSPMETKEENALWDYNSSRVHDGLPPLEKLPKGTRFEIIEE